MRLSPNQLRSHDPCDAYRCDSAAIDDLGVASMTQSHIAQVDGNESNQSVLDSGLPYSSQVGRARASPPLQTSGRWTGVSP